MALSQRVRSCAAGLLLGALGVGSEVRAQVFPLGPEFQVNTYTYLIQVNPDVAADADGDFVVVWSGSGIRGQRYDSAGNPVGSEFQVDTYPVFQNHPSVAVEAGGDFVVVWNSNGSSGGDTSSHSIQGRRFDSTGSAVGSQFQVNTYTTGSQYRPSVSADGDGDFVVVWNSNGSSGGDTSNHSIQGQRYDSTGSAVGSQFQVNTYTTGSQYRPSVSADADGDFVVVWRSDGSSGGDTSGSSIQGQRYDSAGSTVGGQFQVNTYTSSTQKDPSVAAEAGGDFVVVWGGYGSLVGLTYYNEIHGQRYDSAGSAVGSQFQINTYTLGPQQSPSIAADADGDFVVVWESYGSRGGDTSSGSIQGQRYNSAGSTVGSQFQVNTYTTSNQNHPSVSVEAGGDFVVVWGGWGASSGGDSLHDIQGRRYATAAPVPSLSPAALAAAALLACLAGGIALRRRT